MIAVFIDIETTGLPGDLYSYPIEIAAVIYNLDSEKVVKIYHSLIKCPISEPETLSGFRFNGISGKELDEKGKHIGQVAAELEEILVDFGFFMNHGFFICQNPSFDYFFSRDIFWRMSTNKRVWPYHWLDLASMYWCKIGHKLQRPVSLSKNAIADKLGLESEEEPHRAINGALHLLECYKKVMAV